MQKQLLLLLALSTLFLTTGFQSIAQIDTIGLTNSEPNFQSDEFEEIILDGQKVYRSKITNQIFSKKVQNFTNINNASINTDWMHIYWDTSTFDPYREAENQVKWPISVDFGNQQFVMPINGKITSRYGWRKGRPHKGIDLDLITGDNVVAVMDGKVRFAENDGGFGNVVVVRHNNGLETIYAHLSKILVQPNSNVRAGQVIGKGGNTGHSYGSHLHFEVRYLNHAINPEYFIDFEDKLSLRVRDFLVDELWADPRKHRSYKESNVVVKRASNFHQYNEDTFIAQKKTTATTFEAPKKTKEDNFETKPKANNFEKANQEEYHVIVKGDTLAKVARQYGTTIQELTKLNNMSKTSTLYVGKQLRVK